MYLKKGEIKINTKEQQIIKEYTEKANMIFEEENFKKLTKEEKDRVKRMEEIEPTSLEKKIILEALSTKVKFRSNITINNITTLGNKLGSKLGNYISYYVDGYTLVQFFTSIIINGQLQALDKGICNKVFYIFHNSNGELESVDVREKDFGATINKALIELNEMLNSNKIKKSDIIEGAMEKLILNLKTL